jgi:Zn-dependent protease with chaperone function
MLEQFGRPGSGRSSSDFFGRQDDAQRATRRMLVLFVLAVVSVVGALLGAMALGKYAFMHIFGLAYFGYSSWPHSSTLVKVGLVIVAVMAWVSWSRIRELDGGGCAVMLGIGAREITADTTDPVHRRLINIVQEMAIAASVPVPDVYLLENEAGINAFAAGHGIADAAICVTRGCLEKLTRDELQGVIAHEFSHIVHGDMRLNIRLIGLLAGVVFVASTGRSLIRGNLDGGSSPAFYMLGQFSAGLVMLCIGSIGHLAGRMVQAAVSRSREILADAAAVQFTRQQLGIVGALRKIQALAEGSQLDSFDTNEIAHMLFGEGGRWSRLLAAHPTVPVRISALGMPYREQDINRIGNAWQEPVQAADLDDPEASIAGFVPATTMAASRADRVSSPPAQAQRAATAATVATSIGQPDEATVETAVNLLQALPTPLRAAAASIDDAPNLVLSLAVAPTSALRENQLQRIEQDLGASTRARVEALLDAGSQLSPMARLPLLQLALPRLRRLPPGQGQNLLQTLDALVRADGNVDLHEYCLVRLVSLYLKEATQPSSAITAGAARLFERRADFAMLCAILAGRGTDDGTAARRAWQQAMDNALPNHGLTYTVPPTWQASLDVLLERLDALRPIDKELAVEGLATVVLADARVTVEEAELLRLICACLHCPLPPFLVTANDSIAEVSPT